MVHKTADYLINNLMELFLLVIYVKPDIVVISGINVGLVTSAS